MVRSINPFNYGYNSACFKGQIVKTPKDIQAEASASKFGNKGLVVNGKGEVVNSLLNSFMLKANDIDISTRAEQILKGEQQPFGYDDVARYVKQNKKVRPNPESMYILLVAEAKKAKKVDQMTKEFPNAEITAETCQERIDKILGISEFPAYFR